MIEYTSPSGTNLQFYNYSELPKEIHDKVTQIEKIAFLEDMQYEFRNASEGAYPSINSLDEDLSNILTHSDANYWEIKYGDFNFVDTTIEWATVSFSMTNLFSLLDEDDALRLMNKYDYSKYSGYLGVDVKYVSGTNTPIYDIKDDRDYKSPMKNDLIREYMEIVHSKTPELVLAMNRALKDCLNRALDEWEFYEVDDNQNFTSIEEFKKQERVRMFLSDGRRVLSSNGKLYVSDTIEISGHYNEIKQTFYKIIDEGI